MVLCLAMMLSIMVVGAGAAFADQDQIDSQHKDAVDMAVALNIINGIEQDGKTLFKPTTNVTREQMAKMICVLDNGGKDPQLASGNTFSDVAADRWSNKYIESCAARGVVAGVGGGKFNPGGDVTATQAAKMLLVELGYKEDLAKYTGSSWATNVNIDATKNGYYEDLEDIDVTAPLSREHAAQMIWNALQATEITYDYTLVTDPTTGQLISKEDPTTKNNPELLADKYGTIDTDKTTGIMTAISYNTTKDEYTYTIQELQAGNVLGAAQKYTTDADYTDLFGNNVCFVVKDNSAKDVYGAYAKDSVVLASGLMGDIGYDDFAKNSTIEIDSTDYDVDALVTVVDFAAQNHATLPYTVTRYANLDAVKAAPAYYEFSAIDWDDDDDIDLMIVYPVAFGEITYVSADYVRVAVVTATEANLNANPQVTTSTQFTTKKDADYTVYSGAAKEDFALVSPDTTLKTLGDITLLDKSSDKVTSTSKATATIGGSSYDITYRTSVADNRDKTIDFRTINDYVVWSKTSSGVDTSDYVVVTGISGSTGTNGFYQADLLFMDGTTATASIKSVTTGQVKDANGNVTTDGTTISDGNTGIPTTAAAGTLWSYEVNKGKYELTNLCATGAGDKEGFDNWANGGTIGWTAATKAADADAKITADSATAKIASDAIIIIKDGTDYSVKTGADLAKVTGAATIKAAGIEENDNGYPYVTFAYAETAGVSSTETIYGFVTSDITVSKDSDGTYYSFSAWNGTESVNLKTIDTKSGDFSANNSGTEAQISAGTALLQAKAIIGYKLDGDGNVNSIQVYTAADGTAAGVGSVNVVGALTAFDGDDIQVSGTAYTTDKDDTTWLYIDRDGKKGETTGTYTKADKVDPAMPSADLTALQTAGKVSTVGSDNYYNNVLIFRDSATGDLDLVVVDVVNDWFAAQ